MVINGDTLRLFINHLESNKLNQSDFESFFANNNTELKEEELTKKMTRAGLTRKQQAQKVKQAIKQSPHPCIVVGDFNAIPLSQTYQTIKRGLYDCFLETNFGILGNTFYKFHIGIRIDYILCSKQLIPLACKVDKVSHSDHYPVIADIGWKK
jgi:endonuclease/exonuclease/phosphatase family metal-dependent hydrolase